MILCNFQGPVDRGGSTAYHHLTGRIIICSLADFSLRGFLRDFLCVLEIQARLVEQVTGTVRWRESVSFMAANGIDTVYEVGSGKVLTSIARRIERSLNAYAVGTPDDIDGAVERLKA